MINRLISNVLLLAGLTLYMSCGSRRTQQQQRDTESSLRSLHTEFSAGDSIYRRYSTSSAGHSSERDMLLEIYPRGVANFSPDSGFRGEATVVRMWSRGRQATVQQDSSLVSQQLSQSALTLIDSSRMQRTQLRQKEVNRSTGSWPWWLIGLAGMLLGWQLKTSLQTSGWS